ncbi:MAG: nuclear transport factor 2 family protein [Actinomycetota bacterium]
MLEPSPADTSALLAIHRLQVAYGDAVTRRAWDDVVSLFEPGAVVHVDTRTREPFELVAPDGLVEFIKSSLDQFRFFEFAILNAVAEVTGDRATGRVYICELRHSSAGEWTQAYGLYQDEYRRTDGEWRFSARRYSSLARRGPVTESFGMPPT